MRVLCIGYYGGREERGISGLSDGMDRGVKELSISRGGET